MSLIGKIFAAKWWQELMKGRYSEHKGSYPEKEREGFAAPPSSRGIETIAYSSSASMMIPKTPEDVFGGNSFRPHHASLRIIFARSDVFHFFYFIFLVFNMWHISVQPFRFFTPLPTSDLWHLKQAL